MENFSQFKITENQKTIHDSIYKGFVAIRSAYYLLQQTKNMLYSVAEIDEITKAPINELLNKIDSKIQQINPIVANRISSNKTIKRFLKQSTGNSVKRINTIIKTIA